MSNSNKIYFSPLCRFVVYKFPTIKQHGKLFKSGVAYSYVTSENVTFWKLSNISINNTNSIVGRTLESLYNENVYSNLVV